MKSFGNSSNIDSYKSILGYNTAIANNNGKVHIIVNTNQHLTIMDKHLIWIEEVLVKLVYAAWRGKTFPNT
ncbi:hypothetical protein H5410_040851 [Solanum commersonii]|uniref:Uncharacterized protein n=1 Tax=Solanum commersonii TaxID=4109 RepID=A0A9J5XQ50_SOLCO|nr:hypothetical protein H5410_040851 [Solanum commersonii]